MLSTRTRKKGRSVVVTLRVDRKNKIGVNQEYIVNYGEDGTILVPKIEDPFAIVEEAEFYEVDAWDDMQAIGSEQLDKVW